jgi:hypothetical protein
MNAANDDLIVAYVYGELRDDEAKAFEDRLEGDAELRAEVEGLMAAREMLDIDKENAEKFGFDEPPAHLFESIMRAEPLVRPREMTAAAAAVERPTAGAEPTWFHRLRMWIVGGGAVLTGAVAVMLMVQTSGADEAPTSALAPAMEKADVAEPASPAAAADAPAKNEEPEPSPEDKAQGELLDELEQNKPAEAPPPPADPAASELGRFDTKTAQPAPKAAAPMPTKKDLSRDYKPNRRSKSKAKKRSAPKPKKHKGKSFSDDFGLGFATGADDADEGALDYRQRREAEEKRKVSRDPAPAKRPRPKVATRPTPPPTAAPMPDVTKPAPISTTTGSTRGARSGGGVVKVQDAVKQRNQKKAGKKKPPSSKDRLLAKERQNREDQAAEMALTAAANALSSNQAAEALSLFERAQRLDKRRQLGFAPRVGKMKALKMMSQCKEALKLLGVLEKQKLSTPYVIDGLFVGASCAEQLGYDRRAERIYERLAGFPATKKAASPNLRRLRQKAIDLEAPAEAAEADAESSDAR